MNLFGFGKKKKYEKEIRGLKKSLEESFSNVKRDMDSVGKWIEIFRKKDKDYAKRFEEIERKLTVLSGLIENGLMEYKISRPKKNLNSRSIVHERVQSIERSNQSFMNVQSLKKVSKRLTPMQKKVVALLSLAKRPLEYNTLAKELKISVVTVRRHINDIKRAGLKIKEKVSVNNKRKVFFIDERMKQKITNRIKRK